MSASKKTTAKSAKSPAPATKTVVAKPPAKAKAVKKKTAVAAAPAAAVSNTPTAVLERPAEQPVVTPVAAKTVVTTIAARIDIGFGNFLYVRGEGPGLSWDQGLLMTCVGPDLWQVTLGESARPFVFKFLVNDLSWSTGPDCTQASGSSLTFVPEF
jgi:hypothetical protein